MKNYSLKGTLLAAGILITTGIITSSLSNAQKPKTVNVSIDNKTTIVETSGRRVSDVLNSIGYKFVEGSKINHDLNDTIQENMVIDIDTEKNVNFIKAGIVLNTKTFASSVKEFLEEQNVEVDGDDLVIPSITSTISNGENITVDFYKIDKYSKEQDVEFKKEITYDFNTEYGKNKLITKGSNGVKLENFEKTFKNGQLVSDKKIGETVKVPTINEKYVYGSKEIVEEEIESSVEYKYNDKMYEDEEIVVSQGQNGLSQRIYKNEGEKRTLVNEKILKSAKKKIVEKGTKKKTSSVSTKTSEKLYSLERFEFLGIIYWNGYKFTYYSQSVLPGGALRIPGRHINKDGYVADKDGYIVLASDKPMGTVIPTPFGYLGKVYDRGVYGNHFDVYTR